MRLEMVYLKHPAHPLEAVFLTGIWPLLCHNNDPLVIENSDRKYSDPDARKHRNTRVYE